MSLEALAQKLIENAPQTKQVIMNSVEQLIEKGRQQGLQQGLQRAQKAILLKQLRLEFGEISADDVMRVEAANETAVEQYLERVLTADSVAAVLGG